MGPDTTLSVPGLWVRLVKAKGFKKVDPGPNFSRGLSPEKVGTF